MEQQGFPRLLSIFYSEFHPVQGPKVLFEVPEGSITSKEKQLIDFDAISEFIIPKAALCGRKVSITTSSSKVVGYPVSIEDRKYERNALMFNLCFVFDREANTCGYEPVVKKMAGVLRALEVESEFLHDPTVKQNLQGIIEQLLEDLNNYCECQIPINAANTINLKLFPTYPNPPSVADYQVPVCTVNLETLADLAWDMTMQKVIKFINGINHVKKIAELADVDNGMARKCIEHLLYYGCIMMVDIFQFSNIYSVKPSVRRLIEYESWQNECLSYVVKPGVNPLLETIGPLFPKIFSLYCSLKHGFPLKEWVIENKVEELGIDVRRFVSFGVIKGFLFRVHKYPVLADDRRCNLPQSIRRLLNGKHHYDEICTLFGYSVTEMDGLLSASNIKYIYR